MPAQAGDLFKITRALLAVVVTSSAFKVTSSLQTEEQVNQLRNEVSRFYTFYEDQNLSLSPQGPCSFPSGSIQVARPTYPVLLSSSAIASTCPWQRVYDQDPTGRRFPCRLATMRLRNLSLRDMLDVQTCFRSSGTKYGRRHGKLCIPLHQEVPVLDLNEEEYMYVIKNITITVGYTCSFERLIPEE